MVLSANAIENALYKLMYVCELHKNQYKFNKSMYVYYAVNRYISTGRANTDFCKWFINLNEKQLEKIMKHCLQENKDQSHDGIIKNIKKLMERKVK